MVYNVRIWRSLIFLHEVKRNRAGKSNLDYNTIEAYFEDRENVQNPRNVIFGAEETGLHILYSGEREEKLYANLLDFFKSADVKSVLYTGEDLYVENVRRIFQEGKPEFMGKLPKNKIFEYAKSQGIPVEFGAFGLRDRQSFSVLGGCQKLEVSEELKVSFSSSRILQILERIQELKILGVSDLENSLAYSELKQRACASEFS